LQLKLNNKRIIVGTIAFIWMATLAFETTMATLSTDIIKGTCIPWGAYSSFAMQKTVTSLLLLLAYLFPLMLMVFCYSRVVIKLKTKVRWRSLLVTVKLNYMQTENETTENGKRFMTFVIG